MTVYTRKEFCELTRLKSNKLSIYISRKKVIPLADGCIDGNDPRNVAFLQKHSASNEHPSGPEPQQTINIATETTPQESTTDYAALDRQKLSAQVEKLNQEVRLLKIKEEKLKGQVVPSEVIMPIFLQHNQSILTSVKNESDDFVRLFSKKRDLTGDEVAKIKGDLVEWFNRAMSSASSLSKIAITDVVKNFAITKGVGEKE